MKSVASSRQTRLQEDLLVMLCWLNLNIILRLSILTWFRDSKFIYKIKAEKRSLHSEQTKTARINRKIILRCSIGLINNLHFFSSILIWFERFNNHFIRAKLKKAPHSRQTRLQGSKQRQCYGVILT